LAVTVKLHHSKLENQKKINGLAELVLLGVKRKKKEPPVSKLANGVSLSGIRKMPSRQDVFW
jgi:hypothetical protein